MLLQNMVRTLQSMCQLSFEAIIKNSTNFGIGAHLFCIIQIVHVSMISRIWFMHEFLEIFLSNMKVTNSHSSVTHMTFEENSNFKCITSVKLAFLSFNLPPILLEGLCMHGLIQKYFLHNWYFLRYHDLFYVTRVTGYKNGFLRSHDSNGFSIKPISVTKIIFAELET